MVSGFVLSWDSRIYEWMGLWIYICCLSFLELIPFFCSFFSYSNLFVLLYFIAVLLLICLFLFFLINKNHIQKSHSLTFNSGILQDSRKKTSVMQLVPVYLLRKYRMRIGQDERGVRKKLKGADKFYNQNTLYKKPIFNKRKKFYLLRIATGLYIANQGDMWRTKLQQEYWR